MHPGTATRAGRRKPGASSRHGCEEEKEKGRKEKRENRTEHKKGEFELGHMDGVDEGYQQGH